MRRMLMAMAILGVLATSSYAWVNYYEGYWGWTHIYASRPDWRQDRATVYYQYWDGWGYRTFVAHYRGVGGNGILGDGVYDPYPGYWRRARVAWWSTWTSAYSVETSNELWW